MAKKVTAIVKLQLNAGKATPAPPVGPVLAPTADQVGTIIPVVVTVFEDRSYTMVLKTPPVSFLIKKYAGIEKGSGVPNKEKVGTLNQTKVKEIAKIKMPDLNATSIEAAMSMVAGSARAMGVVVTEE